MDIFGSGVCALCCCVFESGLKGVGCIVVPLVDQLGDWL